MLPVKILESIEEKPGGTLDWKKTILVKLPLAEDLQNQPSSNHFLQYIMPKQSDMPRGQRLTPEQVGLLKIGGELHEAECEMLLEILYI